jgi:hypothetical protein
MPTLNLKKNALTWQKGLKIETSAVHPRTGRAGVDHVKNTPELPVPTEYQEQCAIVEWARMMSLHDARLRLLRAGMEGVRLTIGTRVKAKRAGLDASWPDLTLFVLRPKDGGGFWPGLFIELKRRKGGTVSPEQRAMHERLRCQGYRVEVCRGADEAIGTIKAYLGIT